MNDNPELDALHVAAMAALCDLFGFVLGTKTGTGNDARTAALDYVTAQAKYTLAYQVEINSK